MKLRNTFFLCSLDNWRGNNFARVSKKQDSDTAAAEWNQSLCCCLCVVTSFHLQLLQFTLDVNVQIVVHCLEMICQHTKPGKRIEGRQFEFPSVPTSSYCMQSARWTWKTTDILGNERSNSSLVLKHFEIGDKVAHSESIASGFGWVGGTNALLGGSQTGYKENEERNQNPLEHNHKLQVLMTRKSKWNNRWLKEDLLFPFLLLSLLLLDAINSLMEIKH